MSTTLDLFGEALTEIANTRRVGEREQLTEDLMRRLQEKGLTLAELSDRRMMRRSL